MTSIINCHFFSKLKLKMYSFLTRMFIWKFFLKNHYVCIQWDIAIQISHRIVEKDITTSGKREWHYVDLWLTCLMRRNEKEKVSWDLSLSVSHLFILWGWRMSQRTHWRGKKKYVRDVCTLLSRVQHWSCVFERKGISSKLAATFGRTAEECSGGAFSTWTAVSAQKHPH